MRPSPAWRLGQYATESSAVQRATSPFLQAMALALLVPGLLAVQPRMQHCRPLQPFLHRVGDYIKHIAKSPTALLANGTLHHLVYTPAEIQHWTLFGRMQPCTQLENNCWIEKLFETRDEACCIKPHGHTDGGRAQRYDTVLSPKPTARRVQWLWSSVYCKKA